MIRPAYVIGYVFAATCVVGFVDQRSAEVTHDTAMEAERPVFESRADLLHLSMPCTYEKHSRFDREPITAHNTRCTKADRRDE